jgi:hypothetical protein
MASTAVFSRIEAERPVRAGQIVVDGARDARTTDAVFPLQHLGGPKAPITANHHQCLDPCVMELTCGFCAPVGLVERQAPGRIEHRSAPLQDIGASSAREEGPVALHESLIPASDTPDFVPKGIRLTHDGPDGCVHSWGVAP